MIGRYYKSIKNSGREPAWTFHAETPTSINGIVGFNRLLGGHSTALRK